MSLDPTTVATMSPQDLAAATKKMSDAEINEMLGGADRGPLLDEIFRRFPDMFLADKAQGVTSATQFRITGAPDGGSDTYEVLIKDGECTTSSTPGETYDVSFMMAPAEFVRMVTGKGNPTLLVMRGKIKVKGDISQATRFPSYFAMPKG